MMSLENELPDGSAAQVAVNEGLFARLKNDAAAKAITSNIAWLLIDRIIGLTATITVTVLVIRYLGPSDYGLLSYAVAFIGILAPVIQLGLDSVTVRELVDDPSGAFEILGSTFALMFATALVIMPVAVIVDGFVEGGDHRAQLMVGVLAIQFLFQSTGAIDFWFRSQVRSKYVVWSSKAGLFANAILVLWLVRTGKRVDAFTLPTIAEAAITAFGLILFYRRTAGQLRQWSFRWSRAMSLLRQGLPFLFGGLFGAIAGRAGFVVLKKLATASDVGQYAAAVRSSEVFYFLPMALVVSLFPAIVHSRRNLDAVHYDRRIQGLFDVVALLGYAVAIPGSLLSRWLVPLVFGRPYALAGVVLSLHIWTFVLMSIGMVRSTWLVAEGMGTYYMLTAAGGALLNVGLNVLLIPRIGVMGAAWAAVGSNFCMILLFSLFTRKLWASFRHVGLSMLILFRWRAIMDLRSLR